MSEIGHLGLSLGLFKWAKAGLSEFKGRIYGTEHLENANELSAKERSLEIAEFSHASNQNTGIQGKPGTTTTTCTGIGTQGGTGIGT